MVLPLVIALLFAAVASPQPLRAQTAASPVSPAPAPSPSAAQDAAYAFAPPQNWQPVSPASLPFMAKGVVALWTAPAADPNGFRQNINILHETAAAASMSFETVTAYERASIERVAGAGNVKEVFAGSCAPGVKNERYVSHFTLGPFELHVEQIVSVGKAATYVATYEYVEGTTPDVAAEAAINAFCSSANPLS